MLCPSCNALLNEVTRAAVAMNLCPMCKGVWLTHAGVQKLCDRVHTLEQVWDNEHRHYSPRPHYYADDDHYYLQYVELQRPTARHPWSEVFEDLE
jgi:Zn-finger nucleic acid-binding protein